MTLSGGLSRPGERDRPIIKFMEIDWTLCLVLCLIAGTGALFGAMAPGFDDLLGSGGGRELIDRMGGTFIAVVMFFPNGLAGLLEKIPTNKGKFAALLARFQKSTPVITKATPISDEH